MNVFPTLKPGKFGQATTPQVLHPSAEKLNPPGGIGKGGPREYTHTHMGVHEDRKDLKKMGKKRSVTRPTSAVPPIQKGCCLSK
jgi:hypothetical protein